ncbi:hypothetical protein AUC43_19785 [Hymenobacter sedentarius]|uniref:Uncharacterized protein n=1 Tax=Hymenobacter sedentarius TaxID=1411621 RepID=A0A0U3K3C7_9BACT|nr:hypothetical protein AUC43_19785 [Hymenobacter sedentarius]
MQHYCAKYGSGQIRCNDSKNEHRKYQCMARRYQCLFVPVVVYKATQYTQVNALLAERNLRWFR